MQILAHRGYWKETGEKNTPQALRKAFEKGYGIESDVRDFMGEMVISHDIATSSSQKAEEVFEWLHEFDDKYCFAVNIKADGLKNIINQFTKKYGIKNYFLFDMSIPQAVEFSEMGLTYFTRQSDVEPEPNMYENAAGVWMDGFYSVEWLTEEAVKKHIANNKYVCIVSPELHGKEYKPFWEKLKNFQIDFDKVMLCTDKPDEAKEFFYER